MSLPVIRFENVGKLYRLGAVGTGTIYPNPVEGSVYHHISK